jgi:hypothetical protein
MSLWFDPVQPPAYLTEILGDDQFLVGADIVAEMLRRGVLFLRNDQLIDLSRFQGRREPPHHWIP